MAQQQSKREAFFKNPIASCVLATLCCALWGSAFPVIKIGYGIWNVTSSDWKTQMLFAGIRFALAGFLTIIIASVMARKVLVPKRSSVAKISTLSLFQTILQYLFFYIGLARTNSAKSSILDSVSVFFSVIIVCLILKQEKMTITKAVGCVVGFAGVVLINLTDGGIDNSITFLGEGFIILSALSYSISSVMIKQFSKDESPVVLSGYQFMLGGAVMIIIALAIGGRLAGATLKGVLIILYLALLSALAYTLWGILLKYNDVSKITIYGFMIPVFGCVFSQLLLKESLKASLIYTISSLALVSIGIILVNRKNRRIKNES